MQFYKNRIILGIDPGLVVTGFSIMLVQNNKIYLKECGYLPLNSKNEIPLRVKMFHDFCQEKIKKHHVTEIALETPFLGKNSAGFLKLGYLRGIIYLFKETYNLKLHEFSPRSVKQAVTGFGGAQKDQVFKTLLHIFPELHKITIKKYDITDAIAISLCAAWQKI